jgi:hypothetical protein
VSYLCSAKTKLGGRAAYSAVFGAGQIVHHLPTRKQKSLSCPGALTYEDYESPRASVTQFANIDIPAPSLRPRTPGPHAHLGQIPASCDEAVDGHNDISHQQLPRFVGCPALQDASDHHLLRRVIGFVTGKPYFRSTGASRATESDLGVGLRSSALEVRLPS